MLNNPINITQINLFITSQNASSIIDIYYSYLIFILTIIYIILFHSLSINSIQSLLLLLLLIFYSKNINVITNIQLTALISHLITIL